MKLDYIFFSHLFALTLSLFALMSLFDESLFPSGFFPADSAEEVEALGTFLTLQTSVRADAPTGSSGAAAAHGAAAAAAAAAAPQPAPAAAAASGKERRYACTFEGCSYCAVESHHLKRHSRTHSGERPYACSFCPYSAAEQGTLTRHLTTHTQQRPEVTCPEEGCMHTCKTKGAMRQHIRSSH